MPRTCTICTHAEREAIETALVGGTSYRAIASSYGLSPQAVMRHKQDHLPQVIAAAQAQSTVPATTQGRPLPSARPMTIAAVEAQERRPINVLEELETCLARMNKVFDACDAWLTDPNDPTKYDIGPRANEVDVVYEFIDDQGKATGRKRGRLSWLLAAVDAQARDQGSPLRIVETETKYADPRKLILDAANQLRGQLEFLVGASERVHNVERMKYFESEVVKAVREADEPTSRRLIDRLRALRAAHP